MKKLYKDKKTGKISGVLSGLAQYLKIDTTLIRLLYAVFTICSFGTGILLYILMAIIMPDKDDIAHTDYKVE